MPKILNIDGMTVEEIQREVDRGAKFVIFQYCVSIILMTFKRPSEIYFIRAGEGAMKHSIGFSVLSFVLGWWGFPWGPIYTIGALATNFKGGKDVTREVMNSIRPAQ